MGRKRTLDWDAIAKAYCDPASTAMGVAEHFGCTTTTVLSIAKKMNLKKGEAPPPSTTPEVVHSPEQKGEAAAETAKVEATPAKPKKARAKKGAAKKMKKAKKAKAASKSEPKPRKLDWEALAKAYTNPNLTLKAIGKQFGCSTTAIVYVARKLKLKSPRHQGRPRGELVKRDWSDAVKRFKNGDRVADIAKDEKVTPAYLYHAFKYLGIVRPRLVPKGPRDAEWKKAIEMFNSGADLPVIAKMVGQPIAYTRSRLRSLGCPIPKLHHGVDSNKAKVMYQAGMTIFDIAKALQVSQSGISAALRRNGVKLRPRGKQAQETKQA
jgi:transposase-like protein